MAGRPQVALRLWTFVGSALLFLAVLTAGCHRQAAVPSVDVEFDSQPVDPQIRDHLDRLRRAVQAEPGVADHWNDLALACAVNGLSRQARTCYLESIRLQPTDPLPAIYAAVALEELGDLPNATKELHAIVERHPGFAPAWQRLGSALIAAGDTTAATAAFTNLIQLAPEEWRGWAGLGEANLQAGHPAEAIPPLEKAIAMDPYARSARHLLGLAYKAIGRVNEASIQLAAGHSESIGPMSDPWSQRALDHMLVLPDQFDRADLMVARGQAADAVARLTVALQFHPTNVAVICHLATALNAADESSEAERLLRSALGRAPEDVRLLVALSATTAALNKSEESLALARGALERAPQSVPARLALANALVGAGRDAEAAEALKAALELAPTDTGLWIQLGDLRQANLGQTKAALDCYRRAHDLDPIHPVALQRLAELGQTRGRMDGHDGHEEAKERIGGVPPSK